METTRWRITIGGIMVVVGLVGFDLGAVNALWALRSWPAFHLINGGVPMVNILTLGLLALRRAIRRGEPTASLVAFEAVGGAALLIYAACCVRATMLLDRYLDWTTEPIVRPWEDSGLPGFAVAIPLYVSVMTLPQLIPAAVAGWLARPASSRPEGRRDGVPPDRQVTSTTTSMMI